MSFVFDKHNHKVFENQYIFFIDYTESNQPFYHSGKIVKIFPDNVGTEKAVAKVIDLDSDTEYLLSSQYIYSYPEDCNGNEIITGMEIKHEDGSILKVKCFDRYVEDGEVLVNVEPISGEDDGNWSKVRNLSVKVV